VSVLCGEEFVREKQMRENVKREHEHGLKISMRKEIREM